MGTRFMSVGKGKDRKSFPIKASSHKISKNKFNNKSTKPKSRFKVPTLPNDPPRNPTVDELTPSERKRALNILNMLDSSGSGLDKEGKEMKKQLERKSKISTLPNDPPRFDEDEDQEPIVAQFSMGDTVMIEPDNDNDNYDEFRNMKLRITNVAINRDEHRGFDEGVGQALYDLETIHGKEVGFSLYDYELVSA